MADTYSNYPKSATDNAKRALKHRDDNGSSCGTRVGWERANQLASREPITMDTIKRTFSFLSRSQTYDQGKFIDDDGNEICGSVMYAAWGGKSMKNWCEKTINASDRQNINDMKNDKTTQKSVEKRTYSSKVEVRNVEENGKKKKKITGYALKFNQESEDLGGFVEIISPNALRNTDMGDVRALFNHDPNFVLGRTKSGTLKLKVDEIGLHYEIDSSDSQTLHDLVYSPIQRGDVDQSSFGFFPNYETDDWIVREDGKVQRTIHDISTIVDISPVTFPAYLYTEATARSLRAVTQRDSDDPQDNEDPLKMAERLAKELEEAKRKIKEMDERQKQSEAEKAEAVEGARRKERMALKLSIDTTGDAQ